MELVPQERHVTAMWGETGGLFLHTQTICNQANVISKAQAKGQIQWQRKAADADPSCPCTNPCVFFFRMGERISSSDMERIVKFCTGASIPLRGARQFVV